MRRKRPVSSVGRQLFRRSGLAIGTRDHDDMSIRITQPHLAILRRRIDVRLLHNLGAQSARPRDGGVEIGNLEPEQHAMSRRRRIRVDEVRVIFFVPGV